VVVVSWSTNTLASRNFQRAACLPPCVRVCTLAPGSSAHCCASGATSHHTRIAFTGRTTAHRGLAAPQTRPPQIPNASFINPCSIYHSSALLCFPGAMMQRLVSLRQLRHVPLVSTSLAGGTRRRHSALAARCSAGCATATMRSHSPGSAGLQLAPLDPLPALAYVGSPFEGGTGSSGLTPPPLPPVLPLRRTLALPCWPVSSH